MKQRFVAVLLSLCLILAFIPVSAMAVEFDDAQGHWAEAAIDRWSDAGVVTGVEQQRFRPRGGDSSRAQAASVFSELLQLTDEADHQQLYRHPCGRLPGTPATSPSAWTPASWPVWATTTMEPEGHPHP